ncbi:uncharacterized protein [Apostichopus japonicus]|uniref:uncharacterized protein isoform X1 n=1 Tax=Stichopus japonicus TaxID=307972 RepID=UPI003AB910ED
MGFRRSFSGWIGGVTILFGLAFILLGLETFSLRMTTDNQAKAVPLFGGVFLLLTGMTIVAEVLGRSKRRDTYSFFKFPIVSLVANLITFITVCVIIALLTWAVYDDYLNDSGNLLNEERSRGLSIYATVIVMATILLIVSLFGMFVDCCGAFLVVPTARNDYPHGPPAIYDTRPSVIYK